ncbi:hypothetical protein HDV00_005497 [Rhizophlyctis rosea]|nr:hypothetical protein HDV00_005497 [Rhizophlyctis rosea]
MTTLLDVLHALRESVESASDPPSSEEFERIKNLSARALELYQFQAQTNSLSSNNTLPSALLQITTLPSPCKDCAILRTRINHLEKEIDSVRSTLLVVQAQLDNHEAERRDALRRQIGINIEWELKVACLRTLPSSEQQQYLISGEWKTKAVNKVDLQDLVDKLASKDWLNILRRWFADSEDQELAEKYEALRAGLAKLKSFSETGAHPTTYKGKEVDVVMAKSLIDEKMPRSRVPVKWSDGTLKELVKGCIDRLSEMRKENGESELLYG